MNTEQNSVLSEYLEYSLPITKIYYVLERYESSKDMNAEDKRSGNVVEDWDICNLEVGEAVIGLPNHAPFKFKFDLYRS